MDTSPVAWNIHWIDNRAIACECLTPTDLQHQGHCEVICYIILCAIHLCTTQFNLIKLLWIGRVQAAQSIIFVLVDSNLINMQMMSRSPCVPLLYSQVICCQTACNCTYCCIDRTPNALLAKWTKVPIFYPCQSSRSRSLQGQIIPSDICHDLYYCPMKFG